MACQLLIPFDFLSHQPSPTTAQQARLLARLMSGPVSTIAARRELGIMSPSARVNELRSLGYPIFTTRTSASDENGRHHTRVALYILQTNKGQTQQGHHDYQCILSEMPLAETKKSTPK